MMAEFISKGQTTQNLTYAIYNPYIYLHKSNNDHAYSKTHLLWPRKAFIYLVMCESTVFFINGQTFSLQNKLLRIKTSSEYLEQEN